MHSYFTPCSSFTFKSALGRGKHNSFDVDY